MIFLDTNVLIAAVLATHPHHLQSRSLLLRSKGVEITIAAHTLAELYSGLTRIPPPERVSAAVAMQAIEAYLERMTLITLTAKEYLDTVRETARGGHIGGMIYDALLLACARKVNPERIYTWNLKHFKSIAPDLADRMITP
jgi:predicted nucleic acid-binding protein